MTSLTAPASPACAPASSDRLGHRLPELDLVAAPQLRRVHQGFAVEQRPVARPEVFDVHGTVATEHARVHGRHERVVGKHDPTPTTATDGELLGQDEALAFA